MSKQYAYSFDGHYFGCEYDSKEEAIADARKDAKTNNKIIYIGVVNKYKEDCSGLANYVADGLQNKAYDDVGEFAENYMCLTEKDEKILEERLKKVILDFQKEFGYEPIFFTVSNIETINL